MAESKEKVRGYLVISAREASGKNKEEKVVWDPSFVEGFVKGTHSSPVPQCAGSKALVVTHTASAPLNGRVLHAQLRSEAARAMSRCVHAGLCLASHIMCLLC